MSDTEQGEIRITLRDMYDAQQQSNDKMIDAMHQLRGAIDLLGGKVTGISEAQSDIRARQTDFETRLRVLERFKAALPATLIMSSVSVTAVIVDAIVRLTPHGG